MVDLIALVDDASQAQEHITTALVPLHPDSASAIALRLIERKYDTILVALRILLAAVENGDTDAPQPLDHQAHHHDHAGHQHA